MTAQKICISSHKGGVAKSTTAVNLAAGLARSRKKVLLVDADAQGNTTMALGVDTKDQNTLAELLCDDEVKPQDVIQSTYLQNLDIIPSDLSLMLAEVKLSTRPAKEFVLRSKINTLDQYDYILFDCPPSFNAVVMNVLTTAHKIILPISLSYFALEGVNTFLETLDFINTSVAPIVGHKVSLMGILITFYDTRTKMAQEVLSSVTEVFEDHIFSTTIPRNIKLNEAQSEGKSIFDYDFTCKGAQAYQQFTKEILKQGEL